MATTLPATRPASPPAIPAPAPVEAVIPVVRRWGPVLLAAALVTAAGVMLFAGLLGGLVFVRLASDAWPTEEVSLDRYIGNMLLFTAALPSVTAQWARYAARHDDRGNTSVGLGISLGLGLALANLCWYALTQADFGAGDHPYATFFYVIHGVYLVVAVTISVATLFALLRALAGQFSPEEHGGVMAMACLWHLVALLGAVVWYGVWILR